MVANWELNRNQPTAKFANRIIVFLRYVPFQESESLAKRLYIARMVSGKTQEQVSKEMGVDESNLRLVELGVRTPFRKTRQKIERFVEDALSARVESILMPVSYINQMVPPGKFKVSEF